MEFLFLAAGVGIAIATHENRYLRAHTTNDEYSNLNRNFSLSRRCNYCLGSYCHCSPIASSLSSAPTMRPSYPRQLNRTASAFKSTRTVTKKSPKSVPKPKIVSEKVPKVVPCSNVKTKAASAGPSGNTTKTDKSTKKLTLPRRRISLSRFFKRNRNTDVVAQPGKLKHYSVTLSGSQINEKAILKRKVSPTRKSEEVPLCPPTFHESMVQLNGNGEVETLPEYSTEPPPIYRCQTQDD